METDRSISGVNTLPKQNVRVRWDNDGPTSEISSLSVLLDWLSQEGNYSRWKGGNNHSGETKVGLARNIIKSMQDKGITTLRKPKDVISKIGQLEMSYKSAVDFLANTGSGINDESSLKAAIEKRCQYYDLLKDAFGDRPSIRPLITSDALVSDNSDDNTSTQDKTDEIINYDAHGYNFSMSMDTVEKKKSIKKKASSTTSSISEWSDFNSTLIETKQKDRNIQQAIHFEKMKLKKLQFEKNAQFEERRLSCTENETRGKLLLLEAQTKKESALAERELIQAKFELAKCRKRLRDEGVPAEEIEILMPLSKISKTSK